MDVPGARVVQHESEFGEWEAVHRAPPARMRPYVLDYEGYTERRMGFTRRMEAPSAVVPMILNFGPAYRVFGPGNSGADDDHRSFVAGLSDAHVLVESRGLANCLQVNFSPIGARLLFGRPMHELTNRTVALADVFGDAGARIEAQLEDTPDWTARFDILDAFIERRLSAAAVLQPALRWAWERLDADAGRTSIAALAATVGCSRKHLATLFRDEIGLPPKTMARVLRFNGAQRLLDGARAPRWAEIALRSGYYDQAHLVRDFRAFTGQTPSDFARRRLPNGGGLIGD